MGGRGPPDPQHGLGSMSMGNQLSIKDEGSKQCTDAVSSTVSSHEDSIAQTKADIYPPISITQITSCYI